MIHRLMIAAVLAVLAIPAGAADRYPVRPIRVVAFQGSPHPGPTERSGDLPVKAPAEDS